MKFRKYFSIPNRKVVSLIVQLKTLHVAHYVSENLRGIPMLRIISEIVSAFLTLSTNVFLSFHRKYSLLEL